MTWTLTLGTGFYRAYNDYSVETQTLSLGANPVRAWGLIASWDTSVLGLGNVSFGSDTNTLSHVGGGAILGTKVGIAHDLEPTTQTGDVTFTWQRTVGANSLYMIPYWIHADGPITVIDGLDSGGTAGVFSGFTAATGSEFGVGVHVAFGNAPISALTNCTVLRSAANDISVAVEDGLYDGTRSYAANHNGLMAYAGLVYSDGSIQPTPDTIDIPVTVQTPTVIGPGYVYAYMDTVEIPVTFDLRTKVRSPQVLPTVGRYTEMPGRVPPPPSSMTRPVLSYSSGEPVWIDVGSYRPRRIVMRPGITDPPEPVADVDGDDYVYMEFDDE